MQESLHTRRRSALISAIIIAVLALIACAVGFGLSVWTAGRAVRQASLPPSGLAESDFVEEDGASFGSDEGTTGRQASCGILESAVSGPGLGLGGFICPLTGLPLEGEDVYDVPLAVVIENHRAARPQYGLSDACLVYEFLAEGGITRFLAIYTHGDVEEIGPVRSARPYLIETAREHGAVLVHCGGSPEAYAMLASDPAHIDELRNSSAFWRMKTRSAPHNLLTSTDRLLARAASLGERPEKEGLQLRYPGWLFTHRPTASPESDGKRAVISYWGGYKTEYIYHVETNRYTRYMAGRPHVDGLSGKPIEVSSFIVQYVETEVVDDKGRLRMDLSGTGKAEVFTGGRRIEGSWWKIGDGRTIFVDDKGQLVRLNPGKVWVQVVPSSARVAW